METQDRPFLSIVIVKHVRWVQTPETMVQRETTTVSYCLTLTYARECINSQTQIHPGGGTKLIGLIILNAKQAGYYIHITLVLQRQRCKNCKFKANLSYTERSFLDKQTDDRLIY